MSIPDTSTIPNVLQLHPEIYTNPTLFDLPVSVPEGLKRFFSFNLEWTDVYRERVRVAIMVSLADPDTRVRELTENVIRERRDIAHLAAQHMYENNTPFVRILDMLPDVVVDAIKAGISEARVGEELNGDKQSWGVKFDEVVDRHAPEEIPDDARVAADGSYLAKHRVQE